MQDHYAKVSWKRSTFNPLLQPKDIKAHREDFEVIGVFNAGVIRRGDEVLLLLRIAERPINRDPDQYLYPVYDAEQDRLLIKAAPKMAPGYDFSDSREIRTPNGLFLTSISYLRVARSNDGIRFTVEDEPALFPKNVYEAYGIEDCRITEIEGTYYLQYKSVAPIGITVSLATTKDFRAFERHGVMFHPENMDVAVFPEKIGGKYYALHRPDSSRFYTRPDMWIAESPDMLAWGNHRHLMGCREGMWDEGRIGASAVPFLTEHGWVEIYHGADQENRYCLGAVLLDAKEPWKVLARSEMPLMEPQADYEVEGFFGNVVFACGALVENGIVHLYYGAADTCMAYASLQLSELLGHLGIREGVDG